MLSSILDTINDIVIVFDRFKCIFGKSNFQLLGFKRAFIGLLNRTYFTIKIDLNRNFKVWKMDRPFRNRLVI